MNELATKNAPDVWLPVRHLVTGVVSLALAAALLLAFGVGLATDPLGNPRALAVTHLLTLGWVTLTIIGASYQLVPVVLQTRLWSEPIAYATMWLFLPGVAAMVAGFWTIKLALVAAGGSFVVLAFALYVYNIARSLATVPRWGLHGPFFAVALGYLLAVGIYGLSLAVNFVRPFLGQGPVNHVAFHVLLGLFGWITILAMGVAYKLGPMFALSHGRGDGYGRWVLGLVGGGDLLLIVVLALAPGPPALLAALVPLAGVVLFVYDQRLFFRARHRKKLDLGLRFMVIAFVYLTGGALLAWCGAAGLLPLPAASMVILGLLGWAGCLITGQLYKIVPFLVWFHRYGDRAGLEPVPLLRDMYSAQLGEWNLRAFAPVAALLALGTALRSAAVFELGAALALAGALLLLANLRRVLTA